MLTTEVTAEDSNVLLMDTVVIKVTSNSSVTTGEEGGV